MIEVFSVFDYSDTTLFTAVNTMDQFINKTADILEDKDIHLIGMISMFIASKFEETYPLRLDFLEEKVGHNTFSKKEILSKEREMVNTIGANSLIGTSALECITSFFYDFS